MKKKIIVLLAGALMALSASSAFANFTDGDLIRVVYQRSTGTVEVATDLGSLSTLLATVATDHTVTVGGGADAFTLATGNAATVSTGDYYVAYFASNRSGVKQLWLSGTDALKTGSLKTSLGNSVVTALYNEYGKGNSGTVVSTTDDANSYKVKAGDVGSFGTVMTTGYTNVDASLATLASGSVLQTLYFSADYGKSALLTTVMDGTTAITLLTNADGSTTINGTPTPIPAAMYLLGSGLMGMVGLRRKKNA
jgi:hypothetical protein